MIIAQIRSGLGNQLFQYAVARQLAFLNKDVLKLDTGFFQSQTLRSFGLKYFQVTEQVATSREVEDLLHRFTGNPLVDKMIALNQEYLPKRFRRHFLEADDWQYEPGIWKIRNNVYLEGYWQHHKYFDGLDPAIADSLRLLPGVRQEFENHFSLVSSDDQSVSIHIRRGDYLSDPATNEYIGVLSHDYYEQAVSLIKEQLPNAQFYVFSDDLDWAKASLHIDAPMIFIDLGNGRKPHVELELMSECRHNIIANSSFSWWGAYLNRNPGKVVIAPAQWVKKTDINALIGIQLPGWNKI